jgi:hypothetical protein
VRYIVLLSQYVKELLNPIAFLRMQPIQVKL